MCPQRREDHPIPYTTHHHHTHCLTDHHSLRTVTATPPIRHPTPRRPPAPSTFPTWFGCCYRVSHSDAFLPAFWTGSSAHACTFPHPTCPPLFNEAGRLAPRYLPLPLPAAHHLYSQRSRYTLCAGEQTKRNAAARLYRRAAAQVRSSFCPGVDGQTRAGRAEQAGGTSTVNAARNFKTPERR